MKTVNWFSLVKGIIELFTRLEATGKCQIPNHSVFAFDLEIHKRIMKNLDLIHTQCVKSTS